MPTPPGSFNTNSLWTFFNSFNSNALALETQNAELQNNAAIAVAYESYAANATSAYREKKIAKIDGERAAFVRQNNAFSNLSVKLWNATEDAYENDLVSLRAFDATSDFIAYANDSINVEQTFVAAIATAFGNYQLRKRQENLNGLTNSSSFYSVYSSDATRAELTNSLREQRYFVEFSVVSDYFSTQFDLVSAYNETVWNTTIAAALDLFSVDKSYSQALANARRVYSLTEFEHDASLSLAYIDAAITEMRVNAYSEKERALQRAESYAQATTNALTELDEFDFSNFASFRFLAQQVANLKSSVDATDCIFQIENETESELIKNQSEIALETAKSNAIYEYRRSWRGAWNDMFLDSLAAGACAKIERAIIQNDETLALDVAQTTYRLTQYPNLYVTFDKLVGVEKIALYYQERIDCGYSVTSVFFANLDNPDFEYQVCFVAGTPILMSNGSARPIETLRPGDLVLAPNSLDPQGAPQAARVVRFFDVGLKTSYAYVLRTD